MKPVATITTAELRSSVHPWVTTQCKQLESQNITLDPQMLAKLTKGVPGTANITLQVVDGRLKNVIVD